MAGTRAAIRYAKAVLDLAQSQKSAQAVNEDMLLIANSVTESQDLKNMLQSAVVKSSDKKEALLKCFLRQIQCFRDYWTCWLRISE